MGSHALLSPSASARWMNCTAAPLLESREAETGSTYAEEGTLAHAMCAKALKEILGKDTTPEEREIAQLSDQYATGEMAEHVDAYRTEVLSRFNAARARTKDALLLVEVRLDFSKYIPEAFGTSDAVIIADGQMEVIDFKYGKGVSVSAIRNPQMMIYALGAYEAFGFEYDIKSVKMTIIQPRIDNYSEDTIAVADLINWAVDELTPKAREAVEGGTARPGAWCQFCKVKPKCRALADMAMATVSEERDPKLIDNEKIAEILPQIDVIKSWLESVKQYALQLALSGERFRGYKLVEGRSVRTITDTDAVKNALVTAGYCEQSILKPRELLGITDLERLVGRKAFTVICGKYLYKPKGKPTLVPESDKRAPYEPSTTDDDFESIED